MQVKVQVSAKEFASKMQGKREIYHFLSSEVGAYLPGFDNVTIFHLRDLASGKRKMVKGVDIKHMQVPLYEGLKIEEFLKFALDYNDVLISLPLVQAEIMKLPRQYIINIIHTKVGKPFSDWVNERVNLRHRKLVEKWDILIELDPEIA